MINTTIKLMTALSVTLVALLAMAGAALANDTEIGIDAKSQGNSATALGEIDECIEASVGDTIEVDLYVQDVEALIAFEVSLRYDPAIVEITDRDVQHLLASTEDSNVIDGSQTTPNENGRYSVAAVNASDSPSGVSGTGVLARITLTVVGSGISELDLRAEDINGNGTNDRGPLVRNADGVVIDDDDDDSFFDGVLRNASVAVDTECTDASPSVSGGGSDGISVLWIIIGVAIAVIVIGGIGLLLLRRAGAGGQ